MPRKSEVCLSALTGILISSLIAGAAASMDYLNTVVTNGHQDFAEGVLEGYFLQIDGVTLCANPYVIGKYVSCNSALTIAGRVYRAPAEKVWIKTNGQLGGMDVIDAQGRLRCTGPVASNEFRGPDSYLYCP
jgi:hypothetical protein